MRWLGDSGKRKVRYNVRVRVKVRGEEMTAEGLGKIIVWHEMPCLELKKRHFLMWPIKRREKSLRCCNSWSQCLTWGGA